MNRVAPLTVVFLGLLTLTTGLIDAATVLGVTVFAANMTGNVAFIGFSLGGAGQYALMPSLAALLGFIGGAWLAGRVVEPQFSPTSAARGVTLQTLLILAAALSAAYANGSGGWLEWMLLLMLGAGMGLQNVLSLSSPVSDMKTTVMTLTIASMAADAARSKPQNWSARLASVALLLAGSFVGAVIFHNFGMAWTLAAAVVPTALAAGVLGWQRHIQGRHS